MVRYDRNTILKDLKANVIEIFLTQNTSMKCTLMPDLLPKNTDVNYLNEQHDKPENIFAITCWDIEKNCWCSFKIESVGMVQLLDAYQYM